MKIDKERRRVRELFSSELGQEVIKYLITTEVLASTSTADANQVIFNEGRRSLVLDILDIANLNINLTGK